MAETDFAEAKEVLRDYIAENVPAVDILTAFYVDGMSYSAIYDATPDYIKLY